MISNTVFRLYFMFLVYSNIRFGYAFSKVSPKSNIILQRAVVSSSSSSSTSSTPKSTISPKPSGTSSSSTATSSSGGSSSLLPAVILEKGKARLFQDGNPLIYGGAIKELKGNPIAGNQVTVTDHMGNEIGKGIFNPNSTYRVRMFTRSFEPENAYDFTKVLEHRISQALKLRRNLMLPSINNTAYRAINGEGDRLGGLIVDIFAHTVVIQSSAMWVEQYRSNVEIALKNVIGSEYRYRWRQAEARLVQDGYVIEKPMKTNKTSTAEDSATSKTTSTTNDNNDPDDDDISSSTNNNSYNNYNENENEIVYENGVKFAVNADDGQKTGFYCDQRANRQLIRSLSQGKSVLDTYCYSGGFSINALLGGATDVIAVDSSQVALNTAQENILLNNLQIATDDNDNSDSNNNNGKIKLVKMDAVEYMRTLQTANKTFDIVICDPPKLAPTRSSLPRAITKYIKINTLGVSLVKPGGLFLTCSCSAAVTQARELPNILIEAARIARRDITVLSISHAAPDHTVHISYPEGAYLTAMLVCVH